MQGAIGLQGAEQQYLLHICRAPNENGSIKTAGKALGRAQEIRLCVAKIQSTSASSS